MNEQNTQNRGSWTSASNAASDQKCPGRHLASRDLSEVKTESAEHGTSVHDALAKQDVSGLTIDQQEIYDSCLAIESKVVQQFFGVAEEDAKAAKPVREQRFWIHWKDELRHSGQIDAVYRRGTKALIIEYKTLAGDVQGSPQNKQLRDQACLLNHNQSLLAEIGTVVIQPLVTHSPQICIYKPEDVAQATKDMHDRVVASNDPNAKRIPGEFQCRWCKAAAAGVCKEYSTWAGNKIMPTDSAIQPTSRPLIETPVAEWTTEMRTRFMDSLPVALKWLEDTKEFLKEKLKADPESIPGYTLKDGQKRETITNPQAIFDSFSAAGGSLVQFMECIKVGKGDLKEQLAKVTSLKGKKLDAKLTEVIGSNSVTTQNEPSIVKRKE